jgi:hypothetical protein
MPQYDLLLTQNTAAAGIDFSEKYVNIGKGALLSADASGVPTVLAAGTDGYHLVRNAATATGLEWQLISAGHTQGSDTGTTGLIFAIDSDGFNLPITAESASKLGIKVAGGATYADLQAKDLTANKVTVGSANPVGAYELTHKTYVDSLLSANDAMLFKGISTVAALNALTTYNIGWAWKMTDAGSAWGVNVEIGDLAIAIADRAGAGNVNADWTIIQTNLDGALVGPASSTDNYVVLFSGVTGKLLKAGTGTLGTAAYTPVGDYATAAQGTLAANAVPKSAFTAADVLLVGSGASTYSTITPGASTIVGKKAAGGVVGLTKAEALVILNVADGATVNAKAIASEINTGTDDVKFLTALALAGSNNIMGPGSASVDNVPVVWNGVGGKLLKSHASGALGTAAFVATGTFATSAQGTTADGAVPKSLFDANSMIYATADNTPLMLAIGASTFVGRKASGDICAMTSAEAMAILWVTAPVTKTSSGVAGQLAKDANFLYTCDAANVWSRCAKAANW